MPGHVMSRVRLPDGPLDVENTYPRWSCLKGEVQRPLAAATPAIGAPAAADRSKAHEISPIQLTAMIYYNRGVDLLAAKRFAEAARANAKALRLDPGNAAARGNLLATINNWSIELGNCRRFAEAVDLLRRGLAIDAKFAPFTQNYVHVHRRWSDQLCLAGRFDEALGILARAADEMPNSGELRRIESEVRSRKARASTTLISPN
jgi:tetratricopeptide (TPR) repeat protein